MSVKAVDCEIRIIGARDAFQIRMFEMGGDMASTAEQDSGTDASANFDTLAITRNGYNQFEH